MSKCIIEGHYYKVDTGSNCDIKVERFTDDPKIEDAIKWELSRRGLTFYVKCVRCGDRRLINDKTYEDRRTGAYKL